MYTLIKFEKTWQDEVKCRQFAVVPMSVDDTKQAMLANIIAAEHEDEGDWNSGISGYCFGTNEYFFARELIVSDELRQSWQERQKSPFTFTAITEREYHTFMGIFRNGYFGTGIIQHMIDIPKYGCNYRIDPDYAEIGGTLVKFSSDWGDEFQCEQFAVLRLTELGTQMLMVLNLNGDIEDEDQEPDGIRFSFGNNECMFFDSTKLVVSEDWRQDWQECHHGHNCSCHNSKSPFEFTTIRKDEYDMFMRLFPEGHFGTEILHVLTDTTINQIDPI